MREVIEWTDAKRELTDYDQTVLWWCESGGVFQHALDKDEDVNEFLKGSPLTGPVTCWAKLKGPAGHKIFPPNARIAASVLISTFDRERDETIYLVMKHKRGVWEAPGGKLRPGETLLGAAIREVGEETGRRVHVGNVLGLYSNGTADGQTFVHVIFAGSVIEPFRPWLVEHTEYKWVSILEARELLDNMAPRLRCLFEEFSNAGSIFCRDVTDRDFYRWYTGEEPEVGQLGQDQILGDDGHVRNILGFPEEALRSPKDPVVQAGIVPRPITTKLVEEVRRFLGEAGAAFFRKLKEDHGNYAPVLGDGPIPHPVHFREGMQIIMRQSGECDDWTDHDLDNLWCKVVDKVLETQKEDRS